LPGEGLLIVEGCLSQPRDRSRRQTQLTSRNKLVSLDYQKRKEEGMEVAAQDRGNVPCVEERGG